MKSPKKTEKGDTFNPKRENKKTFESVDTTRIEIKWQIGSAGEPIRNDMKGKRQQ